MKKSIITLILLFFLGLVFALTIKGNFGNPTPTEIEDQLRHRGQPFELSPERGRFALTQSLAEDHSFFLRDDIARYVTPDLGNINGKYIILFSPGISILATPLYLLGAQFNLAQIATFFLPVIFALFNFLLIVKICRQLGLSLRSGLIAAFTFLLATPAFTYSISFYQHQITTFLLLATSYLLFSKINFVKLTLAAFLTGISFWIDTQNPIFFIPLAFYGATNIINFAKHSDKINISINLKYALAFSGLIFALLTYVFYGYLTFHNPFQLSGTVASAGNLEDNSRPQATSPANSKIAVHFFNPRLMIHGAATLVTSLDRGMALYSPVILLAILGVPYLYQKEKQKTVVLLGSILFIFTLYTMWGDPYGGWAFGPRYMVPVFGLSAIFLAAALDNFWKKIWFKITFSALFAYSVAINLLGALTTNQVPPKIEAVPLGMKWNFFLNWDMFVNGQTSSFFYKTFLTGRISLSLYAVIIFSTIILVGLLLTWLPRKGFLNGKA